MNDFTCNQFIQYRLLLSNLPIGLGSLYNAIVAYEFVFSLLLLISLFITHKCYFH